MRPSSLIPAVFASFAVIAYRAEPVLAEVGSACDYPSAGLCGVGDLPRVTSREWPEAGVQRFVERAAKGTVAVALGEKAMKLLPDCRLPGTYTEVLTKPGQGRLWATNRPILLNSEVEGAACLEATHVVAAFARAQSGSITFSGVLVPLPCPSISDGAPARGCVGRGLTGPARLTRAESLMEQLEAMPAEKVALTEFLEVYALAPDDEAALGFLSVGHVNSECALYDQGSWVASQYKTSRTATGKLVTTLRPADSAERTIDRPALDFMRGDRHCRYHPVFRKCFSGIAEPVDEPRLCWRAAPAAPAAPPQTRAPTPAPPAKPPAPVTRP